MVLKLCSLIVDMLKMCFRIFDGTRINFDRITAFQTESFLLVFFFSVL